MTVINTWLFYLLRITWEIWLHLFWNHLYFSWNTLRLHFICLRICFIRLENIFFVKLFSPFLRNAIFYLVLHCDFIWTSCKGLCKGLFMQFVKLLIELSYHSLNTWTLFLLIKFIIDRNLHILLCIEPLLQVSCIRFIF